MYTYGEFTMKLDTYIINRYLKIKLIWSFIVAHKNQSRTAPIIAYIFNAGFGLLRHRINYCIQRIHLNFVEKKI